VVNYSHNRISGGERFQRKCFAVVTKGRSVKSRRDITLTKIGTWNVTTLKQGGKLENLKMQLQKNKLSVLGVSEVRWTDQGEIRSGDFTVYNS